MNTGGADINAASTDAPHEDSTRKLRTIHYVLLCLLLTSFLAWAFTHLHKFTYDDDEGMNLLKADAVRRGYTLYRDVWSDQPPLYTVCLAVAFRLVGQTVFVARSVTILFALGLLLGATWTGQELEAPPLGLFTVPACVILAPRFDGLSRAAMIGLPAISLGILSLGSLLRYAHLKNDGTPSERQLWLAPSGLLFGASLLIKSTMAYMGAWIIIWFCWRGWRARGKTSRWKRDVAVWIVTVTLPLAASLLAYGKASVVQIVGVYMHSMGAGDFHTEFVEGLREMGAQFAEAHPSLWIILILGGFGLWHLVKRRGSDSILFAGFWLTTILAVLLQTPFRGRYMFLLLLPHTILAGMGLAELLETLQQCLNLPAMVGQYALAGLGFLLLGYLRSVPAWFAAANPDPRGRAAVQVISEYTDPNDLLITDQGMIPFRAGRSVVPALCVVSGRRIRSGNLTAEELIAATKAHSPQMIVFWEDKLTDLPAYVEWVEGHYQLLRRWDARHRIYVRGT